MARTKDGRPVAALPKGFRDIAAAEARAMRGMLDTIRGVYEGYGFEPLETPAIEYTDALGKFLPDLDRPNEGVFSFQDEDEQWLSLRYDLTAPLARYVAEGLKAQSLSLPFRRYAFGPVWRNEKPGPGRFRQFVQFDADTVGAESVAADAEICMLAADTMERLGVPRGQYVVKVNNRKILDGVLESIGLTGEENAGRRLIVLRAIDKLDKFGPSGVKLLLGEGRKDESGDFTAGAGLSPKQIKKLLLFASYREGDFDAEDVTDLPLAERTTLGADQWPSANEQGKAYLAVTNASLLDGLMRSFGDNETSRSGIQELRQIAELVEGAGYDRTRICIDPSVVRGLEYYTGPVFEAELTFEVKGEDGKPVRFGSVGGGGRYDGLVERFTGQKVPATGFSVGVSRLLAALTALGRIEAGAAHGPVVVLVMDKADLPRFQKLTQMLRQGGIAAEMYLGSAGMKAQMKYADRRGAPCVVIQGGDEQAKGEVQIKDLVAGAEAAARIKDNKEWKEARPAQVSVPESQLVATVRDLLARHRGGT